MELKSGKFYKVILKCDGFFSQARAKDVKIIEMSDEKKKEFNYEDGVNPTHTLIFYDCSCGVRKEIPGTVEANSNNEIIFAVSKQKKYLIKELSK